ncbi:MAG: DUF4062 domain-containing protein [Snowella sp.]|nr:DUF4062 domain-containing protein [Snowella sp.]
MAIARKLQVFVSSTYLDLKAERQAAVEAILTAGHIPAGMELFSAGDQSQWEVIKEWINESDVFLLILGGRYGSIEPKEQKSYTHLEYEYALQNNKALFAVVADQEALEERVKRSGRSIRDLMEQDNPHKLKDFRDLVCSKMVRYWKDEKDIKLAVMETLSRFNNREDLKGWIPGDQSINTGKLIEQLANLGNENAELKEKLATLKTEYLMFNGLTYEQLYQLLDSEKIDMEKLYLQEKNDSKYKGTSQVILEITKEFGDHQPSLIHALWALRNFLSQPNLSYLHFNCFKEVIHSLRKFSLVNFVYTSEAVMDYVSSNTYLELSENGKRFLLQLSFVKENEKTRALSLTKWFKL